MPSFITSSSLIKIEKIGPGKNIKIQDVITPITALTVIAVKYPLYILSHFRKRSYT